MVSGSFGQPTAARTPQIDACWLALRAPADNTARAMTAGTLLPPLVEYLAAAGVGESGVEVIDLGSGTGANHRWLAPRLPFRQHWLLIDQDQALQRHGSVAPGTRVLTADVGILRSVVHRLGGPQLVTCSALLDLLTTDQLKAIGSTLAAARQPALFSLSVTGSMELSPPHPLDAHLCRAFNDHQRRHGRAGPDAVTILTRALQPTGGILRTTETPWLLDRHNDGEFVRQFLTDRVAAAIAQEPMLNSTGAAWLALRLAQLAEHTLEISVGHRDMLILPGNIPGDAPAGRRSPTANSRP